MVDSDGDRSEEPPIAYDVLRDCVTSLAVIVSAFLIDSLAKAAFPDGMPVVTIVILGMLEFTLLMTFITYTAKTIFTLYKEWKTIITNSSINSAIKLVLSSKFIRDTGSSYVSGVGAGLVIGTEIGILILFLMLFSWTPWWVRAIIFLSGCAVLFYGVVAFVSADRANRDSLGREINRSFPIAIAVALVIAILGGVVMSAAFGAQIESWTGIFENLGKIGLWVLTELGLGLKGN